MVKKKRFLGVIVIVFILLCILLIACLNNSSTSSYIYETEDEVIDLFQNNIDDFDLYVDKFYDHHLWKDYFDDRGHNDFPNYKNFKIYITDNEYKYFEEFYQKYHPAFWSWNGLEFRTEEGNVKFIKIINPDEVPIEAERAKSSGREIQYFNNDWICIHYHFEH